jgi:hypothetical protein
MCALYPYYIFIFCSYINTGPYLMCALYALASCSAACRRARRWASKCAARAIESSAYIITIIYKYQTIRQKVRGERKARENYLFHCNHLCTYTLHITIIHTYQTTRQRLCKAALQPSRHERDGHWGQGRTDRGPAVSCSAHT